jgi:anti-sigma factor RsiW
MFRSFAMTSKAMGCNEVRESLLDLATGVAASPEVASHLEACPSCAAELAGFRQTMTMLDEWQTPEPSPYFDTRLMARVREEKTLAATRKGWLGWLWKPALGAAMATALFAGVTFYQQSGGTVAQQPVNQPVAMEAERGSAVADLQALDESHQSYSEFEVLDELQPEGTQNAAEVQ